MKRFLIIVCLWAGLGWTVSAQDTDSATPNWDPQKFIMKNHLHQISGATTIALATLTGVAGITMAAGVDSPALLPTHRALAIGTIVAGATTLGLGLTAYSDRLDTVWPHALFMGLAETGFILNAAVLEPGSLPHRITGVASITSLGLGLLSIILITNSEQ